jgi:DMSO/TMAO reductase YedYZ molybdopterin-dependent catalytic subunit
MPAPHPTPRNGLLTGVLAMLGALAVMRLMNFLAGSRALAESLADGILLLLPVDAFSWLKTTLGDQAKTWLLIGIVLTFLLIGALLGAWIAAAEDGWRVRVYHAATLLFIIAIVLIFAIDRAQLQNQFIATVTTLAISALAFGIIINAVFRASVRGERYSPERRIAIGVIAAGIGALVLGRDIRSVWRHQAATSTPLSEGAVTSAITPNDEFYQISKNFVDPIHTSGPNWRMEITGEVDQPGRWSVEQLQAIGTKHSISTMLCISNEVGGNLIGTAEWTGLPLATVLDEVGAAGDYVWFTGADGYETSVPMDRCRQPQAFLVWGMNGEPLPNNHGAPVRAMIPGLYGMKSVKWITKMEVANEDKQGFWEERGWTNEAVVKPMSRIDYPRRTTNLDEGIVPIRGIAFGGDGGLKMVEVSTDGGDSWHEARIAEQPNPDGIAWSLWQYDWRADAGSHTLVVRMVTDDGAVQTNEEASPLPDGSSGWHTVPAVVNRV